MKLRFVQRTLSTKRSKSQSEGISCNIFSGRGLLNIINHFTLRKYIEENTERLVFIRSASSLKIGNTIKNSNCCGQAFPFHLLLRIICNTISIHVLLLPFTTMRRWVTLITGGRKQERKETLTLSSSNSTLLLLFLSSVLVFCLSAFHRIPCSSQCLI